MCQAFAFAGHDVTLIAQKPEKQNSIDDIYNFYAVENNFNLLTLQRAGIRGGGLYALLALKQLTKEHPDLVYGRDAASCLLATYFKHSVVFETHAPKEFNNSISKYLYKKLLISKRTKKVVVITKALKKHYQRTHPEVASKIIVAADGADPFPEHLQSTDLLGCQNTLNVGYIGSLYPGKGIEVIQQLSNACSEINFHVFGGQEGEVAYWKKQMTGNTNTFFYGFQPPSLVPSCINALDILLLPNQNVVYGTPTKASKTPTNIGQWTSPLKLFEYMSSGKPIISSDLPVLREVLQNNRNAILVPPTAIDAWKNALYRVSNNPSLAKSLGETAKKDFMANYTWQKRAEKIIKLVTNNGKSQRK